MKKFNFLLLLLSCIFIIFLSACGGDEPTPEPTQQECNPWEEHFTDFINTATAYANDNSPENCNAYKSAYVKYLNAYRDYGNCYGFTGATLQEWQEAIAEAEAEIAAFTCN